MLSINLDKSDWYKHLSYTEVSVNAGADSSGYTQSYIQAGHSPITLLLDRCHLDNNQPEIAAVVDYFSFLELPSFCVHRLKPGRYIPTHSDHYAYYANKYNITNLNIIHRFIVFLEDYQDGHILVINDRAYLSYKAGNVCSWSGTTPHAALNYGLTPRYTLQVTGVHNV